MPTDCKDCNSNIQNQCDHHKESINRIKQFLVDDDDCEFFKERSE